MPHAIHISVDALIQRVQKACVILRLPQCREAFEAAADRLIVKMLAFVSFLPFVDPGGLVVGLRRFRPFGIAVGLRHGFFHFQSRGQDHVRFTLSPKNIQDRIRLPGTGRRANYPLLISLSACSRRLPLIQELWAFWPPADTSPNRRWVLPAFLVPPPSFWSSLRQHLAWRPSVHQTLFAGILGKTQYRASFCDRR